jgi:plasmid stabilization system protein ParE
MQPPILEWTPRAEADVEECLDFIGQQAWGKPADRELDIEHGVEKILAHPDGARGERYVSSTDLWLRRRRAAQFVIVYAYFPSEDPSSAGVVSIRSVRHVREADVFEGVKERLIGYGP